ncbi:flagellar assembly protein FliH [Lysinibacillus sp. 54212]|uniref:flagellar assembly protein FliH n=1 Tax=Lysinibacillus sp. 54212 TaxID=3119829 RepID=UPI002FC9DC32
MSRIIRSSYTQHTDEKEIEIQRFHFFQSDELAMDEVEAEPQITQEQIVAERDRLIANAKQEIALQHEQFEQYREKQLQEIEQLKQMWEEEKLVLQQQAHEEGFSQGFDEGIAKANAEMAQSLKAANETMVDAQKNASSYIESQEQVVLELGLKVAERILNVSLEANEELYISIVKRALKEAREMKEVKVYVSPEYHAIVTRNHDELAEMFPTDVPFLIFVNEDLTSTESYIETNHGRIIVTIDTQLNELRLKLREILDSKE